MFKSFIVYSIAFLTALLLLTFFHGFFLTEITSDIRYNVFNVNVFFCLISLVIIVHLKIISKIEKFKNQIGFVFLPTFLIKFVFFFIVFRNSVFELSLTRKESVFLLLPMLLFLVLEVFFLIKILNQKQ
ncbi:MAG: DUF6168 family protein [Flavobacteriaceae bacterium]